MEGRLEAWARLQFINERLSDAEKIRFCERLKN
jgi:hypothetical protein